MPFFVVEKDGNKNVTLALPRASVLGKSKEQKCAYLLHPGKTNTLKPDPLGGSEGLFLGKKAQRKEGKMAIGMPMHSAIFKFILVLKFILFIFCSDGYSVNFTEV